MVCGEEKALLGEIQHDFDNVAVRLSTCRPNEMKNFRHPAATDVVACIPTAYRDGR